MAIIVLSLIGGSMLEFGVTSHKLATRNTQMMAAEAVAESELEMMYYNWYKLMSSGNTPASATAAMANTATMGDNAADVSPSAVNIFSAAVTSRTVFDRAQLAQGWTVKRSFSFIPPIVGLVPGNTRKTGIISYFTAGVIVTGTGANAGIEYRLGRRFLMSKTSIFQFAIFYQGDLELAPGSNMDIHGPVAANGNIYAGANRNRTLSFFDTVNFGGTFNGSLTGATDVTMRNPLSPTPTNAAPLASPVFKFNADQAVARSQQLQRMASTADQQNFLGGADPNEIMTESPSLFPTANDVYHAIVEPPPTVADPSATDNPTIASLRLYNQAALRITIQASGNIQIKAADGTDYSGNIYLLNAISPSTVRQSVYDSREKKTVKVSTIDIGLLGAAINDIPALQTALDANGLLYVNDEQTSDGVIRLVNASQLPNALNGFSVATNNALYVQGNYNTTNNIPSSLIADTVTVLSAGWNDANSTKDPNTRVATADVTIWAGILTGNTPTTATANSGGAQNLVRLMENWGSNAVTFSGAIGQLFNSKYFTAPFPTSMWPVYWVPARRIMNFDPALASNPPPGSIPVTAFARGDLVTSAY